LAKARLRMEVYLICGDGRVLIAYQELTHEFPAIGPEELNNLKTRLNQQALRFMEQHPDVRPMTDDEIDFYENVHKMPKEDMGHC
jgi:hypothetical protein